MTNSKLYIKISFAFVLFCVLLYPLNSVIALSLFSGYCLMLTDYVLISGSVKKLLSKEGGAPFKVMLGVLSYTARMALAALILLAIIKARNFFNVFWVLAGITSSVVFMLFTQLLKDGKKN